MAPVLYHEGRLVHSPVHLLVGVLGMEGFTLSRQPLNGGRENFEREHEDPYRCIFNFTFDHP